MLEIQHLIKMCWRDKRVIEKVKSSYAINMAAGENISNQALPCNINDPLFLETLLMMIRGNTIIYISIKKRNELIEEKNLKLIY